MRLFARRPTPADERDVGHDLHAQRHTRGAGRDGCDVDALIGQLVVRGVVMRDDLLRHAGEGAVDHRVRRRRLHPFMGDGAYLVGHKDPPPLAREYAAQRLGGERAVLGDWSAAALWNYAVEPPDTKVHLILGAQRRDTDHIAFHRRKLLGREVETVHGDLRVTSAARTVADLAAHLDEATLERVVADGIRRRLFSESDLHPYAHDRPGAAKLRKILHLEGGAQWTRSHAEQKFLGLARNAGLPAPRMNRRRGRNGRDAIFDEARVIVELDGFAFHGDRVAFEQDRRRDAERAANGWLTVRFTWRRLRDEPTAVAAELAAILALRAAA